MNMKEVNTFLLDICQYIYSTTKKVTFVERIQADIEKWYNTDKELIDNSYNYINIPWPLIDIIKMYIMRYSSNIQQKNLLLKYLKELINKNEIKGDEIIGK